MSHRLIHYRQRAIVRQNGRCFYCGLPVVPKENLDNFALLHGLSPARAGALQCTAEHLQARCDGGPDKEENIVAACITCNQRRHRMKPAPAPDTYAKIVRGQMERGAWHKRPLLRAFPTNPPGGLDIASPH